ncbi:MAG: site-2 protease family protein [Nitrospirae bacterium]|nr:site-2 protease family protein [Nitrospirota bacterium]
MKKKPWLNVFLFLLTFASTLTVGALQRGADIVSQPQSIVEGLPFSLSLLFILLVHEFSHYFMSRKHGVDSSLPYFIPAPTLFGTLGAFITMRSRITTRNALMDIGSSGPIAGFLVSVVAVVIGLWYSDVRAVEGSGEMIVLGDSILFSLLAKIVVGTVPSGSDIYLHPVAFAGWIGFFVTSLNLIPVGQLDGGHIAYAFLGKAHLWLSRILLGVLLVLGLLLFEGWLIWAVLLFFLGSKHPPILYPEIPLDPGRRAVGIMAFIIFILTFIPVPVMVR